MLATAEEIVAYAGTSHNTRYQVEYALGARPLWDHKYTDALSIERANDYLARLHDEILNHRLGKGIRPWHIVNLTSGLDPQQVWIGIEYETGYNTHDDYLKLMNFTWNNFMHTTVDSEGCGRWPCEITFPPVNLSDFNGNHFMDRILAFNHENKIVQANHSGMIGIHANISTPAIRSSGYDLVENVAYTMSNSISDKAMSSDQWDKLFGRRPYGGFYVRSAGASHYLEGKLFDTTDQQSRWDEYKVTITRLSEVIEYITTQVETNLQYNSYITNLYEYLVGSIGLEELEISYGSFRTEDYEYDGDDEDYYDEDY